MKDNNSSSPSKSPSSPSPSVTSIKCKTCNDTGYYYSPIDRDPIEGYKLATPRICYDCDKYLYNKIKIIDQKINYLRDQKRTLKKKIKRSKEEANLK